MKMKLALTMALLFSMALVAGCSSSVANSTVAGESATGAASFVGSEAEGITGAESGINAGVFYYNFSDEYIFSVRSALDANLDALGITHQNYDGASNQTFQSEQITTAIESGVNLLIINIIETSSTDAAQNAVDAAKTADIPIIFFNREVDDTVLQSYEKTAFVGTDAPEAGHLQGQMIGDFLTENYEAVDLNGDGRISYVLFKGQEGNAEAEARTQFAVEDANEILKESGHPPLVYYDESNTEQYLADQGGNWSAQAAYDYMGPILTVYSEANNNMVELVIANNDGMAEGAISALNEVGYNTGEEGAPTIPVFGVDATDFAKALIADGMMTGTIMQDAQGMADAISVLVENIVEGDEIMANTGGYNVDEGVAKIRVAYSVYTG